MAGENVSIERINPDGFEARFDAQIQQRRRNIIPNLEDILNGDRIDRLTAIIRGEAEKLKNPPKKVLFEKSIRLVEHKKVRKQIIDLTSRYVKNIKSKSSDLIIDITSLENIDFNKPLSNEELKELKKELDFFVFRDCADEINCEINSLEESDPDVNRFNYSKSDPISESIRDNFKSTDFKRLPDDYDLQVIEKSDNYSGTNKLRRRVLVEKINYPTHTKMAKYDWFIKSARAMGIMSDGEKTEARLLRNRLEYQEEYHEVIADLRRIMFGNIGR